MSKQTGNRASKKISGKRSSRKTAFIIGAILIVVGVFLLINSIVHYNQEPSQIAALKKHIFSNMVFSEISSAYLHESAPHEFIVFISICNGQERALVISGKGDTLKTAWESAVDSTINIISEKENYEILWVKADIVNSIEEISLADLNMQLALSQYNYFYRKGIAFDRNFNIAFIEAEVNGNKIISYDTAKQIREGEVEDETLIFSMTNINNYLKNYYNRSGLTAIPQKVTAFTTMSYFCDEDAAVYNLYDTGLDSGRRVIGIADAKVVETAITNASKYLYNLMQPDGKFIYGYFPVFDNELTSYNILRHSGSIWSLINLYRMTQDDDLVDKINTAIQYLLEGFIEYKDENTAYVVERKADEIKLGGNGVAVVMLTEYMDVFNTNEYVDIVRHLANGILELEDLDKGTYYHVLNSPDYSPKEEYRTVYYDGEATFALARAYSLTREQKYLEGAMMAVENFIAKDYTRYRDHWVAYALNEVTKYAPDARYYEFALQNISKNLNRIYNQATSYHTYLELLMIGWQTYERLLESGLDVEGLTEFDTVFFAETIYKRVFHMLNSYFYPELAMYMKKPNKILDAFFIRHDNFRVRIDDIQHFIGGYYYYTLYYEDILTYLSEDFLTSINNGGLFSTNEDNETDVEINE